MWGKNWVKKNKTKQTNEQTNESNIKSQVISEQHERDWKAARQLTNLEHVLSRWKWSTPYATLYENKVWLSIIMGMRDTTFDYHRFNGTKKHKKQLKWKRAFVQIQQEIVEIDSFTDFLEAKKEKKKCNM